MITLEEFMKLVDSSNRVIIYNEYECDGKLMTDKVGTTTVSEFFGSAPEGYKCMYKYRSHIMKHFIATADEQLPPGRGSKLVIIIEKPMED